MALMTSVTSKLTYIIIVNERLVTMTSTSTTISATTNISAIITIGATTTTMSHRCHYDI